MSVNTTFWLDEQYKLVPISCFPKWITRDRACGSVVSVPIVAGTVILKYRLVNRAYEDIYGIYRLDERSVPKRYKSLIPK